MKKALQLLMLLIICLFISSCNSKQEYKLTEITSQDLLNNIQNNKEFIFAFVNEKNDNYQEFMDNLNIIVDKCKLNIYYVDYNHMDYASFAYLVDNINLTYDKSSYYVYQNKDYKVSEEYSNYQNMYKSLKNYTSLKPIDITSDDTLKEYYNKALTEYENGNIAISSDYLNQAWTLKEAKDYYNEHDLYKILDNWENYEFKNPEKLDYTTYHNLFFPGHTNYYVEAIKSGEYANFVKPSEIGDYDYIYYYIKDDIIYTSDSDKTDYTKYKARYKIESITDQLLYLTDLNNNKEYEYIRGA